MLTFSQNKKIAISALALFVVSLSTMVFFLGGDAKGGADVLGAGSGHETETVEQINMENPLSFTTDVGGNITSSSEDFCRLINKSCDRVIKESLYEFVNKEDVSDLAAVFGKLAQKAQTLDSIGPVRISGGDSKGKLVILKAQSTKGEKSRDEKVESIKFWVKDITDKVEGGDKTESEVKSDVQPQEENEKTKEWMDNIYPRIKEMHEQGNKLLVKISKS